METIRAIFENGVFRPLTPPELPEHCEVVFVPQVVPAETPKDDTSDAPKPRSALIGLLKDDEELVEEILQVYQERNQRPWRAED